MPGGRGESSRTPMRDSAARSSAEIESEVSSDELVEARNRPMDPYCLSSVESILEIGESGTAGNGASGQGFRERPGELSESNSDCEV